CDLRHIHRHAENIHTRGRKTHKLSPGFPQSVDNIDVVLHPVDNTFARYGRSRHPQRMTCRPFLTARSPVVRRDRHHHPIGTTPASAVTDPPASLDLPHM